MLLAATSSRFDANPGIVDAKYFEIVVGGVGR
jgi:hypothetical protein